MNVTRWSMLANLEDLSHAMKELEEAARRGGANEGDLMNRLRAAYRAVRDDIQEVAEYLS